MKFGERLTVTSFAAHRRRWGRYWAHLHDHGFTAADDLYRLFAGEVFHDGEAAVVAVDVSRRSVTLRLRNVHAADAVARHPAYLAGPVPLCREDFTCAVAFSGVERFSFRTDARMTEPVYHAGELGRAGAGATTLEIALADARVHGARGRIRLTFASATVEDIAPRVRRYLPGADPRALLSGIDQDPAAYLAAAGTR